jgi:hypothetical protein
MKKKAWIIAGLLMVLATLPISPLFAVSQASSRALEAFRRYEPDFANSLRRLQEFGRRLDNQSISLDSADGEEIRGDAEEVMEFVQKRYDLLEDLYKGVLDSNPADRGPLMDGFQRIEDLFRKSRDFHQTRFVEGRTVNSEAPVADEAPATVSAPATTTTTETATNAVTGVVDTLPAVPQVDVGAAAEKESAERKLRLSGKFRLDWKNRNEKYTAAPETVLPNNMAQWRLSLNYTLDEKNKLILDEKYLQRKRNELVKENILTFSFLHYHSPKTTVVVKDTLHHVKYPDNTEKDYRNNMAEVVWNKKEGKWERLYNLGFENRVYPNYSRSDFGQWMFDTQHTYFVPNGTLYTEAKWEDREYKNSSTLDYRNGNYNVEYNRSFSGNKSEITIADTYDRRGYGNEAVNLFRANYWDNYFTFRYDLPVSKTFTWLFEDEHQRRWYPSDGPRGYAQLKLKTTAKIKIDPQSRGRFTHEYIFNDEQTRARAHKNNLFTGVYDKKVSDKFKVKIEDTFHRRASVVGDIMDFKENKFGVRTTWNLASDIELSWYNEYLARRYSALYYSDFSYMTSAITAFYAQPKKYDWTLYQHFRTFSFRNGGNVSTGWQDKSHPKSEVKFNYYLRSDLKLMLTALQDKTYYKSFDTIAQELLWDFARPITVTEFYGGLEYEF